MLTADDHEHHDRVAKPDQGDVVDAERGEPVERWREHVVHQRGQGNPRDRLGPHVLRDEPLHHRQRTCRRLEQRRHDYGFGVVALCPLHACPLFGWRSHVCALPEAAAFIGRIRGTHGRACEADRAIRFRRHSCSVGWCTSAVGNVRPRRRR